MPHATLFEDLKADHDRHRDLLSRISNAQGDRATLFEQFRVEVSSHAAAEEQTLYATMLADPDLQDDARHSVSEHKEVEDYLTELYALDVVSLDWAEKFEAMKHRYLHHITEEEEDMFPEAEAAIPAALGEMLAERFEQRKPAELEKAATTDPTAGEHKD